ncbi:MarR family transcriptional regulator [Corynebacterium poyangense]|uniref:MarR family transcriptional regulator n=1 Tax=Corynebacterium poyangense TaxID=2684405 RepID=A0A7H0SR80_9CORY|nr:MarR family transcriptional regulator [Corynebacterium poyangense]MBZ8176485.1 MarR family transcriptional regulator [Corynebacterium poyangense]QNQ91055.1 MarR family transcriptional regulator [Corynebacterium poyangense]
MGASSQLSQIPATLLRSASFQTERVRRRLREEVDTELTRYGLTLREYWVLVCLVEEDGTSQVTVAQKLGIDPSDLVNLIDSLEEKKFVQREPDPTDRRRRILYCTTEGRAAEPELSAAVRQAEERALDDSKAKQRKHLRKLAKAVIRGEQDA